MTTTPQLRGQVKDLLQEWQEACERPLYEEIQLPQEDHQYVLKGLKSRGNLTKNDLANPANSVEPATATPVQGLNTKSDSGGSRTTATPLVQKKRSAELEEERSFSCRDLDKSEADTITATLKSHRKKTWTELANIASKLTPFMTHEEHSFSSKLICICFLEYILPRSSSNTGLLNNSYFRGKKKRLLSMSPVSVGVEISKQKSSEPPTLEEVLENCIKVHAAQDYGELHTLTNENVVTSFHLFLTQGLGPFLGSRAFCSTATNDTDDGLQATDLLHALAMAISPEIPAEIQNATLLINTNASVNKRARRSMSCVYPHYFHLTYVDRAEIVRVLAHCLVLPEVELLLQHEQQGVLSESYGDNDIESADAKAASTVLFPQSPLLDGAVPHLRAALKAFFMRALSNQDALYAQRVLINVAVDTGYEGYIYEELTRLISDLVKNRCVGGCCSANNDVATRHRNCSQNQKTRILFLKRKTRLLPTRLLCSDDLSSESRERDTCSLLCPPAATGELLQDFITRYNGSRHYADGAFTRKALAELTGAIGTILGQVTFVGQEDDKTKKMRSLLPASCQVSSLLDAAKTLFYFMYDPLPVDNAFEVRGSGSRFEDDGDADSGQFDDADGDNEVDQHAETAKVDPGQAVEDCLKDALIKCAIQLLYSPNVRVVMAASSLLALAFAYGGSQKLDLYVVDLVNTIQVSTWRKDADCRVSSSDLEGISLALQEVVVTAARLSHGFAHTFISFLINMTKKSLSNSEHKTEEQLTTLSLESVLYLISSIALSQPCVVSRRWEEIFTLTASERTERVTENLAAIFLSCRLAHFFVTNENVLNCQEHALDITKHVKNPCALLRLARHAYSTGNFGISHHLFVFRLLNVSSTSTSYLWLSALGKAAEAEGIVSCQGTLGIPSALPILDSAMVQITSLSSICSNVNTCTHQFAAPSASFDFQLELLRQRMDFFSLFLTTRGLCAEMRLTNMAPKRGTRSNLHQRNVSYCFYVLASRYFKIYRRYGLLHCQQTKTALRTLYALCRFMGRTLAIFFSESIGVGGRLHQYHQKQDVLRPKGDISHPIYTAIRKLSESIVELIDEQVAPSIRASALIEIMDAILKNSAPSPRGFMSVKSLPIAHLRLSSNPNVTNCVSTGSTILTDTDELLGSCCGDEAEVVDVMPGFPCTLFVSGKLPDVYLTKSKLSFSQIIAWYTVTYDGPLTTFVDDDADIDCQRRNSNTPAHSDGLCDTVASNANFNATTETPISSPILPDGKFLLSIEYNAPLNHQGFYQVVVKLGCRDVRYGEWEIPIAPNAGIIFLRVSTEGKKDGQPSSFNKC